jgi:uncharacterized membrane protein YfcA
MNYLIAAFIGLLSGITSGMFGVGGGIVMVPAMLFLLSPPIRDIKQAIGTSLVIMVPSALMGAWRHYRPDPAASNIHWQTAWMVIPLAIAGSFLGAHLAHIIPAESLKRAFGVLLILMGLKLALFK